MHDHVLPTDRRTLLKGPAAGAMLLAPGLAREAGFQHVENGYDLTETAENSRVLRASHAAYERAGVQHTLYTRLAGSWPGFVFTSAG